MASSLITIYDVTPFLRCRGQIVHKRMSIYIIGAGAVGLPLAACLVSNHRRVVVVRARNSPVCPETIPVIMRTREEVLTVPVSTTSLSSLSELDGIVVVAVKSHANAAIASAFANKRINGPIVIMQNGIGVENPFIEGPFPHVCRCVLYMTSQVEMGYDVTFRQISSSPIGLIKGSHFDTEECVRSLSTPGFRFHVEPDFQKEVWKKAIINCVFNSICPLLDADNGLFPRDPDAAALAAEVIQECVAVAKAKGVSLSEAVMMEHVMKISRGSEGVLISTLQDINNGRETEIEHLNLTVARIASELRPPLNVLKTEVLGRMILAKSRLRRRNPPQ